MSEQLIGVICILVMIALIYLRVWIGIAMLIVGFWGLVACIGWKSSLVFLAITPLSTITDYTFAALPLFLMMGVMVYNAGFGADLFDTCYKWIGHLRGGLSMAATIASAILGVITDSLVANITVGKIALPEMERYKYDESLATGSVAAGSTLASLVPPSTGFIIYGLLTSTSIGALYVAAIIPSVIVTGLFIIGIYIVVSLNPAKAPSGPRTSFKEKLVSLKYVWAIVLILMLILIGIYAGIFTPTEAGAIGAFGAIVIGLISRRLKRKSIIEGFLETAQMTAMMSLMMIGAFVFMKLMAVSQIPQSLADLVVSLNVSKYMALAFIVFVYIIMGMFANIIACIIITVPIFFPVMVGLGFDPLWFGVLIALVAEMGLVTPPIGLNVFVLSGICNTPVNVIYRGIWPFAAILLISIIIITVFPEVVLFLPGMMD